MRTTVLAMLQRERNSFAAEQHPEIYYLQGVMLVIRSTTP